MTLDKIEIFVEPQDWPKLLLTVIFDQKIHK